MSKKRKSFISLSCCIVFLSIIGGLYYITSPNLKNIPSLSDGKHFIAHATGSLDGYTYLNSKESLLNSLDNGYKYIEFDLAYTSDSIIVCVHNWEQFNKATIPNICGKDSDLYMKIPSYSEFRTRVIYGKYTPLSLQDVISIQKQRPFTIVTDNICDTEALNTYFEKNIRKNVMVEAFSKEAYHSLKESGYIPMLSLGCISLFNGGFSFIYSSLIYNKYEWITAEQHSSKRTLRLLKKNVRFKNYTIHSQLCIFFQLASWQ